MRLDFRFHSFPFKRIRAEKQELLLSTKIKFVELSNPKKKKQQAKQHSPSTTLKALLSFTSENVTNILRVYKSTHMCCLHSLEGLYLQTFEARSPCYSDWHQVHQMSPKHLCCYGLIAISMLSPSHNIRYYPDALRCSFASITSIN